MCRYTVCAQIVEGNERCSCSVTCVYMAQAVAAKVEQFEIFGQQELFGPEMFDAVVGQIYLYYVRWQISWNLIQTCRKRETDKHKVFSCERS